jgi:DNA modification methylase
VYDIPDSIWDGEEGCEHQWEEVVVPAANGIIHDGGMSGETLSSNSATRRPQKSKFCVRCGAWKGQLGGEPLISLYVSHITQVFREVRRVLRRDGILWLNMGDSYASGKGSCYNPGGGERSLGKHLKTAGVHYLKRSNVSDLQKDGLKPKDLCEIPSEVVRALRDDGWWLRSRIPWVKMNSMPESCLDRPPVSVEYIFLLSKSKHYFYDAEAVKIVSSINSHARGTGVNPKAKMPGPNSRIYVDRDVQHQGRPIKNRQNESFSAAVRNLAPSRNRRDSDWFFESLRGLIHDDEGDPLALIVNPQSYKGTHYSVFPEKLVEPMIKAGTSGRGCCPKCGAPWKRVLEKSGGRDWENDQMKEKGIPGELSGDGAYKRGQSMEPLNDTKEVKTIGWQPICDHYDSLYGEFPIAKNARKRYQHEVAGSWWKRVRRRPGGNDWPTISALVLDPFLGSGTTGRVAERLNRRWVGLDLGYQQLQQKRLVGIQKEMPLVE